MDAIIIPIPKKGNLQSCDDWRGIALLEVVHGEGSGQGHLGKPIETSRERATRLSVWTSQRIRMHRYDICGETAR